MVAFIGVAELTAVNAFEGNTVQLFSEFNDRYQALLNRATWQLAENTTQSNRLTTAKNNSALSASVTLTNLSNTPITTQINSSISLGATTAQRSSFVSDTIGITGIQTRQATIRSFLDNYTPQPFNASLQQLAALPKITGRLLGYFDGLWAYWSRATSDVFDISAATGTLERNQGSSSNTGFIANSFFSSPLNAKTSDIVGDAYVSDGVTIPSQGLTFIFGRQPLIANLAASEIWNASIGGRMNSGSSYIGYASDSSHSNLWSTETMCFAIGSYTTEGSFNYQIRSKISGPPPSTGWTGGTYLGAGGAESYTSLFVLRFN